MEIIINDVEKKKKIVTASTDCGTLKGIWRGAKLPVNGEICRAELTINPISQDEIFTTSNSKYELSLDNDNIIFNCECENIDDDLYTFRLKSSIFLIEIINDNHYIKLNDFVIFKTNYNNISIYPYEMW